MSRFVSIPPQFVWPLGNFANRQSTIGNRKSVLGVSRRFQPKGPGILLFRIRCLDGFGFEEMGGLHESMTDPTVILGYCITR
jgi:hypothetical protein